MNLENYLSKANEPFQEILSDFFDNPEQVEQLYKRVKAIGGNQYLYFVQEHQEDILRYIGLTPARRAQKKWVNHPDILLIRLAALQISRVTVQLLAGIRTALFVPATNGSYREFHAAFAAEVYPAIQMNPFAYFPFQEYENPFFS